MTAIAAKSICVSHCEPRTEQKTSSQNTLSYIFYTVRINFLSYKDTFHLGLGMHSR